MEFCELFEFSAAISLFRKLCSEEYLKIFTRAVKKIGTIQSYETDGSWITGRIISLEFIPRRLWLCFFEGAQNYLKRLLLYSFFFLQRDKLLFFKTDDIFFSFYGVIFATFMFICIVSNHHYFPPMSC